MLLYLFKEMVVVIEIRRNMWLVRCKRGADANVPNEKSNDGISQGWIHIGHFFSSQVGEEEEK